MIDLDDTLARGGAARLDLLRYCVMSVNMEPLFLFLAGEYRVRPTHASALTLFDLFCAIEAPARLKAYELLPPRELNLAAEISRIRERWTAMQAPPAPAEDEEPARSAPSWPARTLFDALVKGVRADTHGRLETVSANYDPRLTPQENLPDGKLSDVQRRFVEHVWQPLVRPRLTAAGFWQVGTI